ncbi:MAG: endonuclease/exonuclease/phosphatase family protein [Thiohalocapsa sp.]
MSESTAPRTWTEWPRRCRPLRRVAARSLGVLVIAVAAGLAVADQTVRVVTWNVETVGARGSAQYDATIAILNRLDADLVALQEVANAEDVEHLYDLASDLGYSHVAVAPYGPFGSHRAALLSDYLIDVGGPWSPSQLSGDANADDITRDPLEVLVDLSETGSGDALRLIITHLKAGTADSDAFRRAIESYRITQLVNALAAEQQPFIVVGDLNADLGDAPQTPASFRRAPGGLPARFESGADISAMMAGFGLRNDPFLYLQTAAKVLSARQLDGTDTTRPTSGRALDYILVSPAIDAAGAQAQIYDCADEALPGSLALTGAPLAPPTCAAASDHLPVFAELTVPTVSTVPIRNGDCLMNWAETNYPSLFAPAGVVTQYAAPYHYRYYSGTNAYLRIAAANNHVYYVDPGVAQKDVGPLSAWLPQAGCQPPPTQCLFDWAERFAPGLFAPAGTASVFSFDYSYRYYPQTRSYLGLSSMDGHIWYLSGSELFDAGQYAFWMNRAGCPP